MLQDLLHPAHAGCCLQAPMLARTGIDCDLNHSVDMWTTSLHIPQPTTTRIPCCMVRVGGSSINGRLAQMCCTNNKHNVYWTSMHHRCYIRACPPTHHTQPHLGINYGAAAPTGTFALMNISLNGSYIFRFRHCLCANSLSFIRTQFQ